VDHNEITEGLRGIVLAEPPLGFVPDDVATQAARRQRDRRVAVGSGVAVTTVAVAAVAVAVDVTGRNDVGPGASPPSSEPVATRTGPADQDLTAEGARNRKHLRQVLNGVLPGATQIEVSEFEQAYAGEPDAWAIITSQVTLRDDAGPANFTLTISGPQAASMSEPLASRCDPHPADENGQPLEVPTLPDGKPLACKKVPRSDGSTVVIEQQATPFLGGDQQVVQPTGYNADHYRADGSAVGIVNENPDRPSPLTEQQLITLVTDPEFDLD
jgi:hypothetical protein